MFLEEAISGYLEELKLANCSHNTLKAARLDLGAFRAWVEVRHNGMVQPEDVTEEDVRSYLLDLAARGLAPATRRRRLVLIRAFFGYLVRKAGLSRNPAGDVPLPKLDRKVRPCLEPDEVERFVRGAVNPLVKVAALVLYNTGLRASELCGIRFADLDMRGRRVRVMGKGSKERFVPLNDTALRALQWYIARVRPQVNTDRVFVTGGGPLRAEYLGDLVRREARRLGFEGISCHSFRHSFATQLLRRDVNLLAICALLGHSSPQTTAIYAHIHPSVLAEAVSRLG